MKMNKDELVDLVMERLAKQWHPFILKGVIDCLTSCLELPCHRQLRLDVAKLILTSRVSRDMVAIQIINSLPNSLEVEDGGCAPSAFWQMLNGEMVKTPVDEFLSR